MGWEGQLIWRLSGFSLKTQEAWQGHEQVSNLTCVLVNITCPLCGECFLVRREKRGRDMATDQWEKMVAVVEIGHGTQGHARRLGEASGQISLCFYFVPATATFGLIPIHSCDIIYHLHFTDVNTEAN